MLNGHPAIRFKVDSGNFLRATLKVFPELADNLNNGGLLVPSVGKPDVAASVQHRATH
jgi:hypothetical protein